MNIVPIEVKAEHNTKAKSLLNYCRKYKPVLAVRISMNDFCENNLETSETTNTTLLDIPLYATFMLLPICREALLK